MMRKKPNSKKSEKIKDSTKMVVRIKKLMISSVIPMMKLPVMMTLKIDKER